MSSSLQCTAEPTPAPTPPGAVVFASGAAPAEASAAAEPATATLSPEPSPPPPEPGPEPRRAGSGPPPKPPALAWEERPAFREVFLVHFPPLAAEALRDAGRYLYDAVLEYELREPEEPWVRARVRALAEDLRFASHVLATLGDARIEAGLTAEEMALAIKAESWAGEVESFAEILEAAVGPEPGGQPS